MLDLLPTPKGRVSIKALDALGNLLWEETTDNLVVTSGRKSICHLLGGDVTNRSITKVAFGINGTAATVGDTDLTSYYRKAIGSVSYPTDSSLLINFTLATGEANGKTLTEFGLYTNDDFLFSRMTRGGIVKTTDIQLVCTWTLTF